MGIFYPPFYYIMRFFLFCNFFLLIYFETLSQNRFGVYYMATNTMLVNNSPAYSLDVYNTISYLPDKEPFYKNLSFTYPVWNYNSYGIFVLIKKNKRISFSGTLSKTVVGHKTFYDGGKSDAYPFVLMRPFEPGQDLEIKNTITLSLLTTGIKAEYQINSHFNVELNVNYSFLPKRGGHVFKSSFSKTISSITRVQGAKDLYYTDINPDGIVSGMAGINCNLTKNFKIHFLYLRTINGINKYKEFMPFKYRQQYRGIVLQLSYNFLNTNKND